MFLGGTDEFSLGKRERNQRPLKNGRFYRQTTSADTEADREPFAASAERSMPALIAHEYNDSPTVVDHKCESSW
jgi:hypothetical protein